MSQTSPHERRAGFRFDKVFAVHLTSDLYGEIDAVARNISDGGMLVETPAPLPMGTVVNVHFSIPGQAGRIRAVAEVKNQYALNYCGDDGEFCSARGMGLRFLAFLDGAEEHLGGNLSAPETLH